MDRLCSIAAFQEWQDGLKAGTDPDRKLITICGGTGCTAFGAQDLRKAFEDAIAERGVGGRVAVKVTGCHGFCEKGPVLVILPEKVFYPSVKVEHAPEILDRTVLGGEVVEEVRGAGLRGRGGAGFPTGVKWGLCRKAPGDEKYLICNADEGDPGAFMDRSLLEGVPHLVIEGMIIAAYAIGAAHGFVYVRGEYPIAVRHTVATLAQARARGLLGDRILGTDFSFDIEPRIGAGAFVCGEETALIASLEGYRGMPRPRPPFPAQAGYLGRPTCINNVETLANVTLILADGGEAYAKVGTEGSKGTKIFALAGKVNNTGLVEAPMGATIRQVVFDIGGGIPGGKAFKAAQMGGPSGGCVPAQYLDLPIDYDSLKQVGAIMGSGGLIVLDEETCMVELARYFLEFTQNESCGKCTPCRVGTKQMLAILERITQGKGRPGDVDELERLGKTVKATSLCGLGQTAPNPVLSTLRYFREEYDAHVLRHECPAGVCRSLLHFVIDPEHCVGCDLCTKACPTHGIAGEHKEAHVIDQSRCIHCGGCRDACRSGAVKGVSKSEMDAFLDRLATMEPAKSWREERSAKAKTVKA